jgi:hypothetical protein
MVMGRYLVIVGFSRFVEGRSVVGVQGVHVGARGNPQLHL